MSWIEYNKKHNPFEWPDHYQIDHIYASITPTDADIDWALARKKQLARLKDDGTLPKDVRREHAKAYKGFCHLIAYIAAIPPGDCSVNNMTKELAPYADQAWGEFYSK